MSTVKMIEELSEYIDNDLAKFQEVSDWINTQKEGVMKKKAEAEIKAKITQVTELLKECEKLAQAGNISFSFIPAYGMGGTYEPDMKRWVSSSENC